MIVLEIAEHKSVFLTQQSNRSQQRFQTNQINEEHRGESKNLLIVVKSSDVEDSYATIAIHRSIDCGPGR